MTRATSLLQQSGKSAPGWKGSGLSRHEINTVGPAHRSAGGWHAAPGGVLPAARRVCCPGTGGDLCRSEAGYQEVRKTTDLPIQAAFALSSPRTSEVKMPIPAKAAQTRSAACKLLTKVL